MELYQLRYLRAISDFGSMSAAAATINVTQPTLSYAMSQLEKELGVSLFIRRNGKLEISSMGRLLVETANESLRQLDDCVDKIKSDCAASAGRVYIGVSHNGLISEAITKYIVKHPLVHLYETLPHMDSAVRSLEIGGIDFLITHERFNNPKIEQVPLFVEYPVALVRADNPLALKENLCIEDLLDSRIIFKGEPWAMMDLLSLPGRNVSPEIEGINLLYEGTDENIALYLAEQGLGVIIVPNSELSWRKSCGSDYQRNVKMVEIPFDKAKYSKSIYISYVKNARFRTQAENALSFFIDYYGSNAPVSCEKTNESLTTFFDE